MCFSKVRLSQAKVCKQDIRLRLLAKNHRHPRRLTTSLIEQYWICNYSGGVGLTHSVEIERRTLKLMQNEWSSEWQLEKIQIITIDGKVVKGDKVKSAKTPEDITGGLSLLTLKSDLYRLYR